jgi:hypothetical protein
MKRLEHQLHLAGMLIMLFLASSMPNGKQNFSEGSRNSPNIIANIGSLLPLVAGRTQKFYLVSLDEMGLTPAISDQSRQWIHPAFPVSLFGIGLFIAVSLGWIRRKTEADLTLNSPNPNHG